MLALVLWGWLGRLLSALGTAAEADLAPTQMTPSSLAAWAAVSALIIVPIGAALGPAWGTIQRAIMLGREQAVQPPRPASRALTIASARSATWSLLRMLET